MVSNNGTYIDKAVFCSKETIRRIAEEHTRQVLEEARQNIESNGRYYIDCAFLSRYIILSLTTKKSITQEMLINVNFYL